ncbi:tyrosine-type recombinase/integrase [Larsenimonas rhizosphaerae]|uniref:tyrosine-type recombinase/integrase n=1 Tax=Larsenimonas rhizosphaerae TaxID=2944682 RepID=UPI00203488BE|nr:site-specific integrase [Larsenimonas rhizosphaerae]MCM2130702.1 site-specific integrase [Larsenimonas rhizosphaerae]
MDIVLAPLATDITCAPSTAVGQGGALIEARSDREAITRWLIEYRHSPATFRHYRKEAERFVLWLEFRGLSLDALRRHHLDEFEQFLTNPLPSSHWTGPTRPRHHPQWRPFRSGLAPASRRQSLVILQGLCGWLKEAGWVTHNPFALMRDRRRRLDNAAPPVIERYFEREWWCAMWKLLDSPVEDAPERSRFLIARRRFLFGFAYLMAPRIAEISQARMNDFRLEEGQWWWHVVGKGNKVARLPVPDDMMTLLREWRAELGLSDMPPPHDDSPVLRALDRRRGVTDNQLYRVFKDGFSMLSDALIARNWSQDHPLIEQLRRATPHWLRHTSLTHQAQSGIELRYLAMNARHARLETTARYLHAENDEWQRQQARHRLSRIE